MGRSMKESTRLNDGNLSTAETKEKEEKSRLIKLGAEYIYSKRGGQITFHGPGQLVGYPIFNLKDFNNMGVRCYVDELQNALMDVCGDKEMGYSLTTHLSEDTGVWIDNSRKIAALGIQVQRYITSHGFALNCNTDMKWFDEIVPCGLVGKRATSLTKECGRDITVQEAIPVVCKYIAKQFNTEIIPMSAGNPELDHTIDRFVAESTSSSQTIKED